MVETYRCAEDMFDAARDAGRERTRALGQIAAMDASRGLSAAPIVGFHGTRRDVNGTGTTVALLDFESMMRSRIEDDERLLAFATSVLYGSDGSGGIASLLSSLHADAVFWRYLADAPWKTCAACLGTSERVLQGCVREAFEMCDAVGFELAIAGKGTAQD